MTDDMVVLRRIYKKKNSIDPTKQSVKYKSTHLYKNTKTKEIMIDRKKQDDEEEKQNECIFQTK